MEPVVLTTFVTAEGRLPHVYVGLAPLVAATSGTGVMSRFCEPEMTDDEAMRLLVKYRLASIASPSE